MTRLSIYRWLPGRAGARSPIAASQTAYMRLQTATLIAGFRLFFFFFTPSEARRAAARA